MLDTGPGHDLGHDPHCYQPPSAMLHPSPWDDNPPSDVNRRGLDLYGRIVWVHGPERIGPHGGLAYCVRTMNPRSSCNAQHLPGSMVWDGGCDIQPSRAAALQSFRERVYADRPDPGPAWHRGRLDNARGVPRWCSPYMHASLLASWLAGWDAADDEG